MADKQQVKSRRKVSELERFNLGFEYDKTLQEIKREVRHRTDRTR